MISPNELSYFSPNGQRKLLKRYGKLITFLPINGEKHIETYFIKNNYFHILIKTKKQEVINIHISQRNYFGFFL